MSPDAYTTNPEWAQAYLEQVMFTKTEEMVVFIVACVFVFFVWLESRTGWIGRLIEWFLSKDPERRERFD